MGDLIIQEGGDSYIRHAALFEAQDKPCIMIPFYGVHLPVVLRRLTYPQIRECGEFSLIETIADVVGKQKNLSPAQMIDYSELQYKLVSKALVSPTYEEVMSINSLDVLRVNAEKELDEISEQIDKLPRGPKRSKLETYHDVLKMRTQFLLPVDFVSTIVSFALRVDDTDIKEVSENMLYEAAIKANKGHDNPADHLPGNFSDFNKEDINGRAWIIYVQRQKDLKDNGRPSKR